MFLTQQILLRFVEVTGKGSHLSGDYWVGWMLDSILLMWVATQLIFFYIVYGVKGGRDFCSLISLIAY